MLIQNELHVCDHKFSNADMSATSGLQTIESNGILIAFYVRSGMQEYENDNS